MNEGLKDRQEEEGRAVVV